MNKIVFPALLAATIMVAGAFAFMPVEQASTVHTTVQQTGDRQLLLTAVLLPEATGTDEIATWTIGQPFEVVSITATNTVDAGGNNDLTASVINTNFVETNDITEIDPKAFTAVGDDVPIIDDTNFDGANEVPAIFGSSTLSLAVNDGGTFAATDSVTVWVLINTRADVALPTAVLTSD